MYVCITNKNSQTVKIFYIIIIDPQLVVVNYIIVNTPFYN